MNYRVTSKQIRSLSDDRLLTVLTIAACLLCWGLCYVRVGCPPEKDDAATPLWTLAGMIFSDRLFAYPAGLFMAIIVAYVIQRICDREMLIRKRTRLPFMLLLLLISTNVELLPVKDVTIVSICLVFVFYKFFSTNQSPEATGVFFNMGVLTGLSELFMPQIIWIIPLLWVGMYRFRSLSVKSFTALMIGMLTVYWIVGAWSLWKRDYSMFASIYERLTDFKILPAELFQYYRTGLFVFLFFFILKK